MDTSVSPAQRAIAAPSRTEVGIAVLRVVIGAIFAIHGAQKVFVFGVGGVIAMFGKSGLPAPALLGTLACLLELLGGLSLLTGLLTRLGALAIAVDMVGAIVLVHLRHGFFAPMGFEYPLALLAASVALAFTGPGAWAIDLALARRRGAAP